MIFNKYPNPIETVFCLSVPVAGTMTVFASVPMLVLVSAARRRYTGGGLARLAGSWGQLCADQRGGNITVSIGATQSTLWQQCEDTGNIVIIVATHGNIVNIVA